MTVPIQMPEVEPLLTRPEVAKIYRVPESTIRAWSRDGTIPAGFFVGKHLRWDPAVIREDVRRRQQAAQQQLAVVGDREETASAGH